MVQLFSFELTHVELGLFALVGLLIGMAKVGISGTGMIAVPILAVIFGGRNSSGIMLPILIMADVFGTTYYRKHTQWNHLKKLLVARQLYRDRAAAKSPRWGVASPPL